MKTNPFKSNLVILFVAIAMGAAAQSNNRQKTCIKIEEITNGKTIKIDTCFIGLTEDEIQKQLSTMGVNDIANINGPGTEEESDANNVHNEVIIMNDDKDGDSGDKRVKVISDKNGKCSTIAVGGNVYAYANATGNSSGQTKIVVKTIDGDSSTGETEIYVYRKIEVTDVSDSDNIKSHTNITPETNPFSGLEIYPNPAESSLTISYKSSGSAPLKIRVYDENGKTVYTQEINEPGGQVNQAISLSGYGPGIYFVNLEQGSQHETKKIIVK